MPHGLTALVHSNAVALWIHFLAIIWSFFDLRISISLPNFRPLSLLPNLSPRILDNMLLTIIVVSFFAGVAFTIWRLSRGAGGDGLPAGTKKLPGPKGRSPALCLSLDGADYYLSGLPLIGSVHQLLPDNPWMSFDRWAKEHGDLYTVNLGGSDHVWISDEQVAHDLLSRKGAIYSDRPHIPALLSDNRTSGQYLPLMSKNGKCKSHHTPLNHDAHQQQNYGKDNVASLNR